MNKNQIDKFFTEEYSYENIPEHVRISSKIYDIVLEGIYKVMYREQLSPYELTQAYKQIADKCDLMAYKSVERAVKEGLRVYCSIYRGMNERDLCSI